MPVPSKMTTGPTINLDVAGGGLYQDNGSVTGDGSGNIALTSVSLAVAVALQSVSTGSAVITIPSGVSVIRVSAAAVTTGASLPAGTRNGQLLVIIMGSAAANTVTFATAAVSLVYGSGGVSLAGAAAHLFIWDSVSGYWYQIGPAAN